MRCISCGMEFTPKPKANRQKKCRKDCGRSTQESNQARTVKRLEHDVTFVGVDGEGITDPDGKHRYVLLSVGDKSISNPKGLTFSTIMAFLYEQFEANPDSVFVGFFLSYDFTQWFKTLPEDRAYYLLHKDGIASRQPKSKKRNLPFPVKWGDWQFDILNNRRFKLRKKDGGQWMYINDVGSFFQKSFLSVIEPKNWPHPIISQEHFELIKRGKERRGIAVLDDEMIAYNVAENQALAILMTHYNRGLVAAQIYLDRDQWFGPGQAAQAWLDLIKAPTSKEYNAVIPGDVHLAALASYYGGWFEIFMHGHVPGVTYEYDINSAYPAIIADLPCLLHGKWEPGRCTCLSWDGASQFDCPVHSRKEGYPLTGITLVYCTVKGSDKWVGPLPHRDDHGLISHPLMTKGWYFAAEIEAAKEAGLIDSVVIDRWYHYNPCYCDPPMREIANLYLRRLQVGKKSPEGVALRLIYNSVYGKNAQSAGHPKYACALYASLITSGCRQKILKAIATHPKGTEDLVMVATDGIYFRSKHPYLQLDPEKLGCWSSEEKTNMCLFLPGVYWDDKTRDKIAKGESASLKSRGVSAKALSSMIGDIDRQFADGSYSGGWPSTTIKLSFAMVTATQAMARNRWETAGNVGTAERELNANPKTKRIPMSTWIDGITRTFPYEMSHALESEPYDRLMGIHELSDSIDGPLDSIFAWALKGG